MRTLITGATGQVAFELQKATHRDWIALTKKQLDISQLENVLDIMESVKPDRVINTAAYTQVDEAEKNPEKSFLINKEGAKNLAQACEKIKCTLIHLSTDYIFDGQKKNPYVETDQAAPLNIYGKSKWEGEEAVRHYCEKHLIIRVSAVFGSHGNNFVKTIIRLAQEREQLQVVNDQIISPTPARDIASMLWELCDKAADHYAWGTYHFSGASPTNWYEFASQIVKLMNKSNKRVHTIHPISTSEYLTAAKRPSYSVLDCQKLKKIYNINQPDWLKGLENVVSTS